MSTGPEVGDIWRYTTSASGVTVQDYYLILEVTLSDRSSDYPWATKLRWLGSSDPNADEEPVVEHYEWPEDGYCWEKVG
jgi:hypothetical protein